MPDQPFFATKLSKPALRIWWKEEWPHKPVFRQTVRATAATSDKDMEHGNDLDSGGDSNLRVKSDDAVTSATFDARLERLRIAMGLFERLAQYSQRRGYAECVDSKCLLPRSGAGVNIVKQTIVRFSSCRGFRRCQILQKYTSCARRITHQSTVQGIAPNSAGKRLRNSDPRS